jgi:hypothetical protein
VTAPDHGFRSPPEHSPREPAVWPELVPVPAPAERLAEPEPLEPHWLHEDPLADAPEWTGYRLETADVDEPEADPATATHVGLELSEKLQRLLEAVDSLDEQGLHASGLDVPPSPRDQLVIDADRVAHFEAHDDLREPVALAPSLIIRYDAGVELRFSGQSALFLERLLRVSADLDALARALPPAGDDGTAEPPTR